MIDSLPFPHITIYFRSPRALGLYRLLRIFASQLLQMFPVLLLRMSAQDLLSFTLYTTASLS